MHKMGMTAFLPVILIFFGLSSCVSFYCSGQLGHELINVQVPDIRVAEKPYSQLSFSLEADVISSIFIDGDGAYNFQGAVQYSNVHPISDNTTIQFTGGLSGWGGSTVLDTGRFLAKNISGNSPFYGGSVMGAAAMDYRSGTFTAGVGYETIFSYEDGPYRNLREVLNQLRSSGGDSYRNLSPSGLTVSAALFDRFSFGISEKCRFGISTYYGVGYPDLLNLIIYFPVPLYGGSVSACFQDFTIYLAFERMEWLNSSFSIGVMKRFF